ncbi:MAG: SDR family NAD(P)-dependent oxidoreductase [Alphaproteobacteria bacterium]|nr:SDR family NAD(P)-dependent oxidoreductase [Alphaproteobacteria bacterium]
MNDVSRARVAVVTGASSGIGRAIAKRLIDADWRVFGSVRKEDDAEAARVALGPGFTPLIFDVTNDAAVRDAARAVGDELGGRTLSALVNNAGIAVSGPARYVPLEDVQRQFDVNVFGVLRVTQAFLPLLGASPDVKGRPGKIVNMSSVAGQIATPFFAPYAMSKHALEALSAALRRELMAHGIDVLVVGPGAVRTPIWEKGEKADYSAYEATEYGPALRGVIDHLSGLGESGIAPEAVGDLVHDMLTGSGGAPRRAILNNRLVNWVLPRLMPTRLLDRILANRFGVGKKAERS